MQSFKSLTIALAVIACVAASTGWASERGTPEEAQAMAERAVEFLRADGPDVAFPAFTDQNGQYLDRDLYVFVIDKDGVVMAHGGNANLVGRNIKNLRDVTGKLMIQEILSVEDRAWVDYRWQNPVTNAVEEKTSYVIKVRDYSVGVGAYRS